MIVFDIITNAADLGFESAGNNAKKQAYSHRQSYGNAVFLSVSRKLVQKK